MNEATKIQATSPLGFFVRSYETNTSSGNIPALISQFADVFMAAGPGGSQCIRSCDFALALPKRIQLFESLGRQSTKLVSCQQTKLDTRFVLVETRWHMTFAREGQPPKEAMADSLLIVDTASRDLKIVFYLAHQDLVIALKNQETLPV